MGRLPKRAQGEHTEESIRRVLNLEYLSNPRYLVHNLYVFGWESDYLAQTRAGYWYEVEIKISVADFKNDFTKEAKHTTLRCYWLKGKRPHYFSYCVPKELVQKVLPLVPPYAGLLAVNEYGHLVYVKEPPRLHSEKYTDEELRLAEKFYYNWQAECRKNREHDRIVRELKYQISFLKEEYKASTGHSIYEAL